MVLIIDSKASTHDLESLVGLICFVNRTPQGPTF